MPDLENFRIPPDQEQLHEILTKIVTYQHSLTDGRAVELDELCRMTPRSLILMLFGPSPRGVRTQQDWQTDHH